MAAPSGLDWPGLLAWSTKYHDGTKPTEFKPMSEEDKRFLEEAMESAMAMIEDCNKLMLEAIEQLKSPDRTEPSVLSALEICDRCCDDPDVCRNVEKFDGVQALLDLVGIYGATVTVRTLEILALMCSNNQPIQEAAVRRGALKVCIDLFHKSSLESEERCKAFRALVSAVRNVEALERTLLDDHSGVEVILQGMAPSEDARTQEKAVAFVTHLVAQGRLAEGDVLRLSAALPPLLSGASDANMQYRETLADCAFTLASKGVSDLALRTAVEARVAALAGAGDEAAETELETLKGAAAALASKM